LGFGITAIGMVDNIYVQNVKTLDAYDEQLNQGRLPQFRGVQLTLEDEIRRDLITRLICHFELDFVDFGQRWHLDVRQRFAAELEALADMAEDGLLTLDDEAIRVLPAGRLLIRNICMVFDAYLRDQAGGSFSKVI
jgi:oxygen-independent coproporphyrinogen-3 oxidase